jgi:N-acetylneuraminate synthase
MNHFLKINGRSIGLGHPCYIVAELSANHGQSFDEAVKIIEAAKESGADAVKIQTYTPDTLTIDCDNQYFRIKKGSIWENRNLYGLYREAQTPWEWQPRLKKIADRLGLDLFSTPFDDSAVDFLAEMDVPAYKIASFEIVDLPLVRKIAETGKPVILSTGMANLAEIDEAVGVIRSTGNHQLALLKCTSAYPAPPEDMNLRTIEHLGRAYSVPAGLSDHTLDIAVPVAAVTLGACIIEKHVTLSRSNDSPDSAFSLEPSEFKKMVETVRTAEKAIGDVCYEITEKEKENRMFRRSLFAVEDIKTGQLFTEHNIRSIRPGHGLHTRYLNIILGKKAACDIVRGAPLGWDLIG